MLSPRLTFRLTALLLIGALVGLVACDNVGVQPKSSASAPVIFSEDGAYESYLAKLYGGLNVTGQEGPAGQGDISGIDEGFSQYLRLYWEMQELTADGAIIAWDDADIDLLNAHQWSDGNQFSRGIYDRIFFQVSQTNEFLRQSTSSKLDEYGVSEDRRRRIPQYRAEARFLRALSYWHGLDLFANIPLVDESFPRGTTAPEQSNPQAVFDFIESELMAITDGEGDENLPDPGQSEYGRVDKAAAWMLLAKLYQNAPVYIDQDRSADVIEYTSRILDSGAYSLHPEYHELFLADNDQASSGFIFTIPHDGLNTQHFGGTTFLGNAPLPGSAGDRFGLSGWEGIRTTGAVVDLYSSNDTRPMFPNLPTPGTQFFTEGRTKDITNIGDFANGGGFIVPKYQNVTSTGEPGQNATHSDVDFPMFRLADVHLMYAEAHLRGGGGNASRALELVNDLRERAGLGRDIDPSELTLQFILDERGRELLWEAHRRTDLIRFGQFTGSDYVWPCKGKTRTEGCTSPAGVATDAKYDLFPLPASELRANPNLEQNPGY
jgi:hypothetical protein